MGDEDVVYLSDVRIDACDDAREVKPEEVIDQLARDIKTWPRKPKGMVVVFLEEDKDLGKYIPEMRCAGITTDDLLVVGEKLKREWARSQEDLDFGGLFEDSDNG